MFNRKLKQPLKTTSSYFLFGPRGIGKTTWLKLNYPTAIYIDLLRADHYTQLLANPLRLSEHIHTPNVPVIIDEIQKIPQLLNEVHRLIERNKTQFILTGSSARSLRKSGTNLLGGRAKTFHMYPLTAAELGNAFSIQKSIETGNLPLSQLDPDPKSYLTGYIQTYLREEILQEGLTRNIGDFSRFLETASFSQASSLNYTEIAREAGLDRQKVTSYFNILEDLLISYRLPVFSKKSKRKLIAHQKFYYFDVGVYKAIRPKGPLDRPEEIGGAAYETLVLQEIVATLAYQNQNDAVYFWRTATGQEVDFIIYGENGLKAIEVKSSSRIQTSDLSGLNLFKKDYPMAKCICLYMGDEKRLLDGHIELLPIPQTLPILDQLLLNKHATQSPTAP